MTIRAQMIKEEFFCELIPPSCPLCESDLLKGAVSLLDQTPAFYCMKCNFCIALLMTIVEPKEKGGEEDA